MDPNRTSPPDRWSTTLTKLRPDFKRRRTSLQLHLLRSKTHLADMKSRLPLLHDHKSPPSPSPTAPPSAFPFEQLPRPLRNRIYTSLFALMIPSTLIVRDPTRLPFYPEDTFPRILPGLCYINRAIYAESTAVLLKGRWVVVPDLLAAKTLSGFLSRGSNKAFCAGLRALWFGARVNWQPFATHVVQGLLARCGAVRHVKIGVAPEGCVLYDGRRDRFTVRSAGQVVQQVDLSCLIGCGGLRRVTLECVGGEAYAVAMGERVEAVFRPVVGWVRRNVCEGKGVRLKVEYELWGVMVSNGFEGGGR